jgi:hypothetical protein
MSRRHQADEFGHSEKKSEASAFECAQAFSLAKHEKIGGGILKML